MTRTLFPMSDGKSRLTFFQLVALALVQSPLAAISLPIAVFLPPLYAGELGLGTVVVGQVIFLARMWDVVTDPIMGLVSDRYPTKTGRRRHWILIGMPILVAAAFLIFNPTILFPTMTGAIFLGLLFVMYAGWTMVTINHYAWASEINPAYHDRSRLQGALQAFALFGLIVVLIIPIVADLVYGASQLEQVASVGWYVLAAVPAAILLAVFTVPEVRPSVVDKTADDHTSLMEAFHIILGNKPLLRILLVFLLEGVASGVLSSLFVYFTDQALGLGLIGSSLLLVYFLVGALCTPIWIRISYKFGKKNTFLIGVAYAAAVVPILWVIPYGNFGFAFGAFAIFGISNGVQAFMARSMMGDIADIDAFHSGKHRTGLIFSMLTLITKVGIAAAIILGYSVLLPMIGFAASGENSPESIQSLRALFVLTPFIIYLIIGALMWNFPLDEEKQKEIRAALEARDLEEDKAAGLAE